MFTNMYLSWKWLHACVPNFMSMGYTVGKLMSEKVTLKKIALGYVFVVLQICIVIEIY